MPRDTPLTEAMTADLVTVRTDTEMGEVVRLMAEHKLSSLPVVDGNGHLLGSVGDEDVVIEYAHVPEPAVVELLGGYFELPGTFRRFRKGMKKVAARTAGEAMDEETHTLSPDDTLEDAASLMVYNHIHHVPILDGDKLVGIISRTDVVRRISEEI